MRYGKRIFLFALPFSLLFVALVGGLAACQRDVQHRPYGVIRLGNAQDLRDSETYLPEPRVVLRHDAAGFYAMSTLCTFDLSPLTLNKSASGDLILKSTYSSSKYDAQGAVILGPAKAPLPYYAIELADDGEGTAPTTLYAIIGNEVSPQWRLKDQ